MRRGSGYHDNSWAELHGFGVKFAYPEKPDRYNIDTSVEFNDGALLWPDIILDGEVSIGKNSEIGRGAVIIGNIRIGENVKIGHGIKVTGEGYIGNSAKILHDIHDPKIGENCTILGQVRDSTVLGECYIGENAEINRSFLSFGVKAKHGCGIRDAYVDYCVNVSEFVTFANLAAGEKKKTRVGSRTMIGVGSRIMGGSQIGEECYIADGSRVDGIIPSRTYFNPGQALIEKLKGRDFSPVKPDCSWHLEGNYLVLAKAIGPEERTSFQMNAFVKCGQNRSEFRKWLKTPISHLNGRTPIQCIMADGEKSFLCLLEKCGCEDRDAVVLK